MEKPNGTRWYKTDKIVISATRNAYERHRYLVLGLWRATRDATRQPCHDCSSYNLARDSDSVDNVIDRIL